MSTPLLHTSFKRTSLAIATAALLAACGGGGGDGGPTLIDLTAANRDSVAHAAAGSLLAIGASSFFSIVDSAGAAAPVRRAVSGAAREQPLAQMPMSNCAVSGTVTGTHDDHNNNGMWEVGEAMTVVFSHCQDDAYNALNGTAVVTINSGSQTSFTATLEMTQFSQQAINGRHGMTIDGSLGLNCTEMSFTSMRCTSTADGPIRAAIHTHVFDDTVTLQRGFVEDATFDDATGHTQTTMRGTVASTAAGGAFSVTTDVALGWLGSDPYPHEGQLRVAGNRGVMLFAPQSATQVKIDLDSEGDGVYEASKVEEWDWLL